MEYTLVKENNREELIRKVSDLIRQGWVPLGGISIAVVAPIAGITVYCQAMIKN